MFVIWKGKFSEGILNAEQRSYATGKRLEFPKGLELIDCALGTNPLGMPECLKKFSMFTEGCNFCDYPTPEAEDLKEEITSVHDAWKLSQEQILLSGGSIGVLVTLARLLVSKKALVSGISPQFTDAVVQFLCNGATYRPVCLEAPKYNIKTESLLQALMEKPDALYLDRPNNPTGQVLPLKDMEKLAIAAMESETWIISDEAYGDYMPDEESAAALDFPNIITCRSFSKGLGAAGLRVGYAISRDSDLSKLFKKAQPPFILGTFDGFISVSVLNDEVFLEKTRSYVKEAKSRIVNVLKGSKDLIVADTDPRAPIFLVSQKNVDLSCRFASIGISCEAGSGFFGLDNSSVRLRVPSPNQLDAFLERIKML